MLLTHLRKRKNNEPELEEFNWILMNENQIVIDTEIFSWSNCVLQQPKFQG